MKLHKKFTKYLVENYPLLFHSKFFQLLGCGILMWLISYLVGFLGTSNYVLKHFDLDLFYFESYFVMFHSLTCVIVLSVWAIHFYKMKPVRNYYPLQKGYFTKLFLLLIFPFFLLISAYFPFASGATSRAKISLAKEEFEKDKQIANLAYPFLMTDSDYYDFGNKVFPDPFPMEFFSFSVSEDEKNRNFNGIYYNPSYKDNVYLSQKKQEYSNQLNSHLYSMDSVLTFGSFRYVFYTSKEVYFSEDSCGSFWAVDEFLTLDEETKSKLKSNSMLNFSHPLLTSGNESYSYTGDWVEETYSYSKKEVDSAFYKTGIPIIHQIVETQNYVRIEEALADFDELLNKYNIRHYFDSEKLINYLKVKNFSNFDMSVVSHYKKEHWKQHNEYEDYYYDEEIDADVVYNRTPFEIELLKELMFFEEDELTQLNDNYNQAWSYETYYGTWVFLLMFAFFLTSFVIWFEFAEVKSFLLSIPIGGGLAIIIAVILMLFDSSVLINGNDVLTLLSIILGIIVMVSIGFIMNPRTNRFISSVMLNITYVISHFLIFMILMNLHEKLSEWKPDPLSKCNETYYDEFLPIIDSPWSFLVVSAISVFLFYLLVPIWKAKKV